MDSNELDDMLTKAKLGVLFNGSTFLATITFSLKHVWDTNIPTACTNGKVTKYNPEFMSSLTPDGRIFVVAHEAWHIALNHLTRLGDREPKKFNKAADYVINQMLVDNLFVMPKIGLETIGYQDSKYRGMSTVEVYNLLEDEPEDSDSSSMMDGDIQANEELSEQDSEELEAEITSILVKARAASKMSNDKAGAIPGEVNRLIDSLINPKLPWPALLKQFLTSASKSKYSWTKPNKRFFPEYILPTKHSLALDHIAVAFDTSGSLSDAETIEYISETQSILHRLKPEKMTLIACDYKIHNVYEVTYKEDISKLKFKGYGGTRFEPVFEYLDSLKSKPKLLIYFTDLYAHPIKIKPKYPVVWVCNSDHKPAPFGKTIYTK